MLIRGRGRRVEASSGMLAAVVAIIVMITIIAIVAMIAMIAIASMSGIDTTAIKYGPSWGGFVGDVKCLD